MPTGVGGVCGSMSAGVTCSIFGSDSSTGAVVSVATAVGISLSCSGAEDAEVAAASGELTAAGDGVAASDALATVAVVAAIDDSIVHWFVEFS